jgi:hypothetical protein
MAVLAIPVASVYRLRARARNTRELRADAVRQAGGGRWTPCWFMFCACLLGALTGCKSITPTNYRTWAPDQNQLAWAEFHGDQVTVHNVRNCKYVTNEDYVVQLYDRTYDLNKVAYVDFTIVPFKQIPSLGHTMVTFGFDTGDHVLISIEIRKEAGEDYNPIKGFLRQYELMYVVADERDMIQLCAVYRDEDVYMYRVKATREQARAMFVDMLERANKLIDKPEFYNTLTNNCTNNIQRHVNRITPGRVPYQLGVLLPGLSDRLAYDLGLIDTDLPFEQAKERANISELAKRYEDSPDFSLMIRR